MSNTITAYFKGRIGVAESVYQNDYGIVMAFDSIDLPAHFDCYFSRLNQEEALPGLGADNRVTIPNSILANPGNVTIHIPLHTGEDDSEVEYVIYFKVIGRARPIDDGTPTQMTAIERALALLSQPITNIEEIVNEALAFTGETFEEMQEDLDEWKTGVEGGLNTWKGGVEADFDTLQAQFDTAVGAVTTDTEVTDIRVGADGVTDTTAGASVRRQFADVNSALTQIVSDEYDSTILSVLQTVDDWALKKDGFAESNSSYRLLKYNINAGDIVLVEGAERYQFQASPSVPSSGTSPKIGGSHTGMVAVAPNGANYLIVSKKKSASATASVIVSIVEDIVEDVEINTKGIADVRSNARSVVSNDIFDIIDGVKWYQGTISGGALIDSDYRITTDYIVVTDFLNYTKVLNFALANGWSVTVNEYDIVDGDYSRIKYSDWIKEVYALDEDTKAIRIVLRKDDESQIGISASSNVKAYIPTYNSENEVNVIDNNVGFLVDAFYKKILLSTVGYTNGYRLNETDGRAHIDTNYNLEKYSVAEGEIIHVANADRYQFQPVPSVTVSGESTLIGSVQNVEKTIEVPSGAKYLIVSVIASEMPIVTKYDDSESLSHYAKVLENETIKVERDFVPFTVGTPNNARPSGQRYNRANLMFFTDSHIDMSNPQQSRANVKHAIAFVNNSPIQFDAVMNAGDAITPFYITSKSSAKALAKIFFDMVKQSKVPVIYAKGNHDLNDWENYPSNTFDDADWSEIFYDYAESEYGIVRQTKENDEKSTWHYLDLADHKIRIISVDVQDTDKETTTDGGTVKYHGGVAWYISQEQMDWLISTALNFDDKDEKDWGVICVLHQDISYSTLLSPAYESAIEKFKDVCVAFNTQTAYSDNYTFATDPFYNLSINADFTRYASETNKPHMICWLMGHEHVDLYEKVNGINMIWTANSSAFPAESDQRLVRAVGTNTQNCFDIMSVDTVHRKIRMFRFGAGVDCFGVGGNRWLPDGLSY